MIPEKNFETMIAVVPRDLFEVTFLPASAAKAGKHVTSGLVVVVVLLG